MNGQRNVIFERKTVLRSPRGRLHAWRLTVGQLWAMGRVDLASQHPTPQRFSPEVPPVKLHICLTLQGPLPEAGWVFVDPMLPGHHRSPTHIFPVPLEWHPLGFLLNEQAQSVKAGRLVGGTALGTRLQPRPRFPDDHTRHVPVHT